MPKGLMLLAETSELVEIEISNSRDLVEAIECTLFDVIPLDGNMYNNDGQLCAYVDDEGLLVEDPILHKVRNSVLAGNIVFIRYYEDLRSYKYIDVTEVDKLYIESIIGGRYYSV